MRINEEIRAREIRVVSPEGEQLGIMSARDGLKLAQEKELDLVEVAPTAKPPVCRIMDFGKYKYEQSKKEHEAKRKQKVMAMKEVRMTPKIEDHDFQVKARSTEKFLKGGDKVKVSIRFRGREIVHANLAREIMGQLAGQMKDFSTIEREARVEGRNMIMILAPKQDN